MRLSSRTNSSSPCRIDFQHVVVIHGVTVKATSSDMSMVSGRLIAIGRMYGPSSGDEEHRQEREDHRQGGEYHRRAHFVDGGSTASRGGSFFILK